MLQARSELYAYEPAQRALHWFMAAIIIVAIGVGLYAVALPKGDPSKGFAFLVHKSFGMTALLLSVPRIVLRIVRGAPPYRVALGRLARLGTSAGHAALYVLLFCVPIGGYILSSAADRPIPFFGLFEFPRLVAPDKALAGVAEEAHVVGAWILIVVIAAHVLAALWHRWVKKDDVMARMAPRLAKETVKISR
jgi:cytochrome b561